MPKARKRGKPQKPYVNPIDHGTPETRRKLRKESPWMRIVRGHRVSLEMQAAADEVRDVFLAVSRVVMFKRAATEVVDGGAAHDPFAGMSDKAYRAWRDRYKPWADEMSRLNKAGGPPRLAVTISVLVDEMPCWRIEQANGWKHGRVGKMVTEALEQYVRMAGWKRAA